MMSLATRLPNYCLPIIAFLNSYLHAYRHTRRDFSLRGLLLLLALDLLQQRVVRSVPDNLLELRSVVQGQAHPIDDIEQSAISVKQRNEGDREVLRVSA